jgi:hypothetical protein
MLLYETLSQPLIFLIVLCAGLGSGLVFDIRNYISFLCAKNKIIDVVLDILSILIVCFVLFLINLKINFGQFRFYIPVAFFIGLIIERYTLGLFVAKICSWCYNKFRNLISKLYGKRAKKKEGIVNN